MNNLSYKIYNPNI